VRHEKHSIAGPHGTLKSSPHEPYSSILDADRPAGL
jgi:hypothetical protein